MFISADWLIWQWRDQSNSLSASNSREILCKLGIVTWSNSTEAGHAAGENISSESEELGQALLDVRSESWWLFQCDSKGIDCIGKALWKAQRVQMLSKPSFVHGLVTEPLFLRPPIFIFFFLLYFDCEPSGAGFGVCSSALPHYMPA